MSELQFQIVKLICVFVGCAVVGVVVAVAVVYVFNALGF